ncbi:MAG: hypothetical protein U1E76_28050 [Planctomycetota bacterium]
MIPWHALALIAALGQSAGSSSADDRAEPEWMFRWSATLRSFAGATKVREHDSEPEHLDLDHDLHLDSSTGLHFELARDSQALQLVLEADMFGPSGSGELDHDFAYDEATFAGNRPFDVSSRFLFVRGSAAFKQAFTAGERERWFGPVLGFEYPNFSLAIEQGTTMTKEYWWQFLPYPVVGVAGESRLCSWLTLEARVVGTYLHRWPTPFAEGGRVSMSARMITAQAFLSATLTDWLGIDLGLQYQYWDGELHSHEDGNELTLRSPAVMLGLHVRF